MAQQNQKNPKTPGKEKSYNDSDIGSNNPVKKEGSEKRDIRDTSDKANQNLGAQKYRESNVETGRNDQSAR